MIGHNPNKNIKAATELLASILCSTTDKDEIIVLLNNFLYGAKLNWQALSVLANKPDENPLTKSLVKEWDNKADEHWNENIQPTSATEWEACAGTKVIAMWNLNNPYQEQRIRTAFQTSEPIPEAKFIEIKKAIEQVLNS